MSRSISISVLPLLLFCSFGCGSKPTQSNPQKIPPSPDSAYSNSLSIPISEDEMKELTEPDPAPNPKAEKALAFLRLFKTGESIDQVKKNLPSGISLRKPTVDLPYGEMPENMTAAEFIGDQEGFFYFEGEPKAIGKLLTVEVFTDNKSYAEGAGKRRIRAFSALLGKPLKLRKEEDDDGSPMYEAEWRDGDRIIRYADVYEWGSALILNPIEANWR